MTTDLLPTSLMQQILLPSSLSHPYSISLIFALLWALEKEADLVARAIQDYVLGNPRSEACCSDPVI